MTGALIGRKWSLTRLLKSWPNTDSAASIDNAAKNPNMADRVVVAHWPFLAQVQVFYRKSYAVEANCAYQELNM